MADAKASSEARGRRGSVQEPEIGPELWCLVLSKLNGRDLASAELSCKAWQAICRSHALWHHLHRACTASESGTTPQGAAGEAAPQGDGGSSRGAAGGRAAAGALLWVAEAPKPSPRGAAAAAVKAAGVAPRPPSSAGRSSASDYPSGSSGGDASGNAAVRSGGGGDDGDGDGGRLEYIHYAAGQRWRGGSSGAGASAGASLSAGACGASGAAGGASEQEHVGDSTRGGWAARSRPSTSPSQLQWLPGHGGRVNALAAEGDLVASGGEDKVVRVWDAARRRAVHSLKHDSPVADLLFASPNVVVAASGTDAHVWRGSRLAHRLRGVGSSPACCMARADEVLVVGSAGWGQQLCCFDLYAGRLRQLLPELPGGGALCLATPPDLDFPTTTTTAATDGDDNGAAATEATKTLAAVGGSSCWGACSGLLACGSSRRRLLLFDLQRGVKATDVEVYGMPDGTYSVEKLAWAPLGGCPHHLLIAGAQRRHGAYLGLIDIRMMRMTAGGPGRGNSRAATVWQRLPSQSSYWHQGTGLGEHGFGWAGLCLPRYGLPHVSLAAPLSLQGSKVEVADLASGRPVRLVQRALWARSPSRSSPSPSSPSSFPPRPRASAVPREACYPAWSAHPEGHHLPPAVPELRQPPAPLGRGGQSPQQQQQRRQGSAGGALAGKGGRDSSSTASTTSTPSTTTTRSRTSSCMAVGPHGIVVGHHSGELLLHRLR